MINNYLGIVILGLVFCVNAIRSMTMTKDEVLKFKVIEHKYYNADCPNYSYNSFNGIACSFRFICLEDVCQTVNLDTDYLEFSNKKYIAQYCSLPGFRFGSCKTPKCSSDTDCISNHCEDGVCLEGDHSPFTECRDTYQKNDNQKDPVYMVCGRLDGEKCSEDQECAGICVNADSRYHSLFKDKIGEGKDVKRCQAYGMQEDGFNFIVVYHLVVISIILIFSLIMCYCLCSYCFCSKERKVKTKEDVLKQ